MSTFSTCCQPEGKFVETLSVSPIQTRNESPNYSELVAQHMSWLSAVHQLFNEVLFRTSSYYHQRFLISDVFIFSVLNCTGLIYASLLQSDARRSAFIYEFWCVLFIVPLSCTVPWRHLIQTEAICYFSVGEEPGGAGGWVYCVDEVVWGGRFFCFVCQSAVTIAVQVTRF